MDGGNRLVVVARTRNDDTRRVVGFISTAAFSGLVTNANPPSVVIIGGGVVVVAEWLLLRWSVLF